MADVTGTRRGPGRPSARPVVRQAFVDLLADRSFTELTVEEVVRKAGVSRTAFYAHWSSLTDLLREVATEVTAGLHAAARGWLDGEGGNDPAVEVRIALDAVLQAFGSYGPLVRAAASAAVTDPEVNRLWNDVMDGFTTSAARRVRADQRVGRARADIDPRAAAEALCWMVERVLYRAAVAGKSRVDPLDIANVEAIWLHSLYPDAESGSS